MASSTAFSFPTSRSMCSRSRSSPKRPPRNGTRRPCSSCSAAPGRIAAWKKPSSTMSSPCSRSDEMSAAVSRLRAAADPKLPRPDQPRKPGELDAAVEWLEQDYALPRSAAEQIAAYLAEGKRALGVVPTAETLVLERFFDEAGGMQLVLHAPLGSRINKAWGLALRKKFCQSFNFELQAAATGEALVLSLGPSHSFPLDDVFRYLNPKTVRETRVQAVLDSPIFETRWRWTTTLALAVPRNRNGTRLPAQIQRMIAEELLAAIFPQAAACLDNIQGACELPKHTIVD